MLALFYREVTGEGQQVDVSIQESVVQATFRVTPSWDMMKVVQSRGSPQPSPNIRVTSIWPCKDGLIYWRYFSGPQAERYNVPLVKWMRNEGITDDFLEEFDWEKFDLMTTTQDIVDRLSKPTGNFFRKLTKAELLAGSVEHNVMLFPIAER